MSIAKSIILVILSGVFSEAIAIGGVEYGAIELGALYYMLVPMVVFVMSTIAFLLLAKKVIGGKLPAAVIATNILAGLAVRLEFFYQFHRLF